MTERIDHANEAMACLIAADGHLSAEMAAETGEYKADVLAYAQVHATLALVEQQRIANLIALARNSRVAPSPLFTDEPDAWDFDARGTLRPEIAAALGIEEVQL